MLKTNTRKQRKRQVHAKKTFLLSSKTLLQQDLGHVFQQQGNGQRRKRQRIQPPPGLLPLLSHQGITHDKTNTTSVSLTPVSCTGVILHDRIWLCLTFNVDTQASITQAHLTWMSPEWTPTELDRSTLFSPHSTHALYAATTLPPLVSAHHIKTSMDIRIGIRYKLEESGQWMDSTGLPIHWVNNGYTWIINNGQDAINHWAPIIYPHKVHLCSQPTIEWISLNDHVQVAPDASLLLVQDSNHFAPIQAQIYGLSNHILASFIQSQPFLPWDGTTMTTRDRLQHTIVALMDQTSSSSSSSSSQSRLANREHSLAQLSTLLPSSFINPS
ncbi:hypothetical protein BC941DRAFT_470255 [Chlamydoabsidia padenii]|nr:hypothetical protein BC941DRAFT_470255 [Chlamydoabsidia padenii]